MLNYHLPLVADQFYHIFNRGNNRENIFYQEKNYHYFLEKYDDYLSSYLNMYAFSLIPNHFHFLVKVKGTDAIAPSDGISFDVSKKISEQFRRFFLSYSQAINRQQGRSGSLFQKNFKRIPVYSPDHLIYLVYYIHANPQRHRIIADFKKYPYSSYRFFLTSKETKLCREEVVTWFESLDQFLIFHQDLQKDLREISYLLIED